MAEIVAAFATSHYPVITHMPEVLTQPVAEGMERGLDSIRGELRAKRVDTIIVISNEHYLALSPSLYPSFGVVTMAEGLGPVEKFVGLERNSIKVPLEPDLAEQILSFGVNRSFDLTRLGDLAFEHAFITIIRKLTPAFDMTYGWLLQNCNLTPRPRVDRCFDFGRMVGEAIRAWRSPKRVAILGTGGLAHSVGTPDMYARKDFESFDRHCLYLLSADPVAIGCLSDPEMDRAGSGAHEIRNWAAVAGAAGGAGQLIYYGNTGRAGAGIMRFDVA